MSEAQQHGILQILGLAAEEADRLDRKADDIRSGRFTDREREFDNEIRQENQARLERLRVAHGLSNGEPAGGGG